MQSCLKYARVSGYSNALRNRVLDALFAPCISGTPETGNYVSVQRNLALELVRVTEAAALASGRWFGKGDKNAADQVRLATFAALSGTPLIFDSMLLLVQAAVDQMRRVFNAIDMDGVVVIGEGEKDEVLFHLCEVSHDYAHCALFCPECCAHLAYESSGLFLVDFSML